MDLLSKLFGGKTKSTQDKYFIFNVRCKRCGEIIEGRVDVDNDLSVEYENDSETFHCRKVLMGDGKNLCYQRIEVCLRFDSRRNLVEHTVESGGDFI